MVLLTGRVYQPFTTLGVETPEGLQQHITASQLAPLAEQYASKLAKAPLHPPASDGLQRVQTLARPDPHDPSDPVGFMSLSRFFEESAALPALLKESGNMTGEEAAAQHQTLTAAAAAAAAAGRRGKEGGGPPRPHALHLVAAEAAQTVSSASPNPDDLSPAAFLDTLEFVQLEAGRHLAKEGTRALPLEVAAPAEEEEEEEEEYKETDRGKETLKKGDRRKNKRRDWRELLSQTESIRYTPKP